MQEFWTETVYTMQTLWIGFSSTVVSAWKKAEESIAQGIGYINGDENIVAKELKQHTRYLRGMAQNGGRTFA